ncbi:MAG: ROK family protein [Acidimicrobiales bacterium]
MGVSTATTDERVTSDPRGGWRGPGEAGDSVPGAAPAVLAVDIGGTKLAAAVVDHAGSILARARAATPGSRRAEDVFGALTTVLDEVLARPGPRPEVCGVGCGGPMLAGGGEVSPLNIPAWRGFPLQRRLTDHLGLPVAVDNDAKALALGEGWLGAARGLDNYLAMVVSTGIGGGLVLDGRLLEGAKGNAGHIGHVVVEPDGRRCACGGRGCLEAEASGLSIASVTGRPTEQAPGSARRRCGTLVGRAVASVANLLDLDLAVVGGSVALGFGAEFFDGAQREVDERARLDFSRGTRVIPAGLGSDGPLLGAAAVARRSGPARPGASAA